MLFNATQVQAHPSDAGVMAMFARLTRAPIAAAAKGIDNMKMTALSAWAVNELGRSGADQVAVSWAYGDPKVEIQASFFGEDTFSSVSDVGIRARDQAVMNAISNIIDDRIEALHYHQMLGGAGAATPWWHTLGVTPDADKAEVEKAFRQLAITTHPDLGSSEDRHFRTERMAALNVARDQALAHLD